MSQFSFVIFANRVKSAKTMLQRLLSIAKYYLFWIAFFVVIRLFFVIYNIRLTSGLDFGTVLGTFGHGLKLDLSMGG